MSLAPGSAPRRRLDGLAEADIAQATGLYQVLREDGSCDERELGPELTPLKLLEIYRGMLVIRVMDERLLALQRQGRIGFYGEARGQEGSVIGSAAATRPDDWILPALREAGAGIYRGMPLSAYIAQIFGTGDDPCKGRQMPCHPGWRGANYVPMSSCIATQLPHAVGVAWGMKIEGKGRVCLGYIGDGGTSEEDFHVAMNFAGVYQLPLVIVCQNNQWAISTPQQRQTAAETIALKGLGYGLPSFRCDGNDVLAVYNTVAAAVARARAGGGASFVETLTYRMGAHSSSDDPTRYRDEGITEAWKQKDPLLRMRRYLKQKRLLDPARDAELAVEIEAEVRAAVAAQEAAPPPPVESIIEDVFAEPPAHLREQLATYLSERE